MLALPFPSLSAMKMIVSESKTKTEPCVPFENSQGQKRYTPSWAFPSGRACIVIDKIRSAVGVNSFLKTWWQCGLSAATGYKHQLTKSLVLLGHEIFVCAAREYVFIGRVSFEFVLFLEMGRGLVCLSLPSTEGLHLCFPLVCVCL